MDRRVVITGMGIWSCIGTNIEEVTESLYTGRSGIGLDQDRLDYGFRSGLTGIVKRPQLKGVLDRRTRTGMSEEAEYAFMASRDAFQMSKIDDDYLNTNEVGVIFGNDSSANTVNMNMNTIFHLRGVNFSVSSACASGSHSIGLAYLLIKQGLQDVVLCGGAQEVNKYAMSTFDALNAFSVHMDEPTKASRPFDRDRDGLVPSGGAAALVLEDYDHAVKRGANILAEVCGYGFSSNGGGISQPSDEGSFIAVTRAMKDAGVTADDIDYINAHATSTQQGDMYEAMALNRIFKGKRALVSSTKSMTGHECWMAGASEIVYSIIMMQKGFVAPNINFVNPDEHSRFLNLTAETVEKEINVVLSNSFGFGGTNSALIIKKPNF